MILRLNGETMDLLDELEAKVAARLDVDHAGLCVCTGPNHLEGVMVVSICFETQEDDTFALLEFDYDPQVDLKELLNTFMANSNVVWLKRGSEIGSDEEDEWGLDDVPALTATEIKTLREIIRERDKL